MTEMGHRWGRQGRAGVRRREGSRVRCWRLRWLSRDRIMELSEGKSEEDRCMNGGAECDEEAQRRVKREKAKVFAEVYSNTAEIYIVGRNKAACGSKRRRMCGNVRCVLQDDACGRVI